MSTTPTARQERKFLLTTAKAVATKLKQRIEGTPLHIRIPSRVTTTNTDGWNVVIGNLGKSQPRLEIWYDRFAGYPERKLCACFRSENRRQLVAITKRVDRKLYPHRVITQEHINEGKTVVLTQRLGRHEFNLPILERYADGRTFYGIYSPTREAAAAVSSQFCGSAVGFFEDVARTQPHAKQGDAEREVYPQFENRKLVTSHLHRERSGYLATERKIHDDYQCQVCGLVFEDAYGELGKGFAEAHHRIPLSCLNGKVRTRIEDLATVCANCHRMLHRMDSKYDDVEKLKRIVKRRKARR